MSHVQGLGDGERPFRNVLRSPLHALGMIALAALLVTAILYAVSPDVRATTQNWFTRFVEVDSPWELLSKAPDMESPGDAPGASAPSLPGAEGSLPPEIPRLPLLDQTLVSVDEAQAETPFAIKVPAALPEGYSLRGAAKPLPLPQLDDPLPADGPISRLPSAVFLTFENKAGEIVLLSETAMAMSPPAEIPLPVGKDSIQDVSVNGQPGQYVEGAWSPQGWNAIADHHVLRWQGVDGVTYDLISQSLGLAELLAIAESIP